MERLRSTQGNRPEIKEFPKPPQNPRDLESWWSAIDEWRKSLNLKITQLVTQELPLPPVTQNPPPSGSGGGGSGSGGTGGAPIDAQFVTLALHDVLSKERVLLGTANQIDFEDLGPNDNVRLFLPQNIDLLADVQFGSALLENEWTDGLPHQALNIDITDTSSDLVNSNLIYGQYDGAAVFKVRATGDLYVSSANSTESFIPLTYWEQTWDTVGAFYEGLYMSITDNGASALSRLLQFQVNASTVWAIRSNGEMILVDDVRQTFNPGTNKSGLNVGAHTADPSTLLNADLWYQSTANSLRARINGVTVDLGGTAVGTGYPDTRLLYGGGGSLIKTDADLTWNETTEVLSIGAFVSIDATDGTANFAGSELRILADGEVNIGSDELQLRPGGEITMEAAGPVGIEIINSDLSATVWNVEGSTGSQTMLGRMEWLASTPSQITANQNNYAITASTFYRLSTDASRTITGFDDGVDGRFIIIANVGSFPIVLANQSASSSAENRIITGTGGSLTLLPDEQIKAVYDATTQRWRLESKGYFATGNNQEVLFNDNGIINGDPGLTFDKSSNALNHTGLLTNTGGIFINGNTFLIIPSANSVAYQMTGHSLTGANASSTMDLTTTWNTSGTPTAIILNVTDTASNAASRLLALQVGSADRFVVDKAGIAAAVFFKTTTALVALGGGAAALPGTIGGSGPATATQNSWLQMKDSSGADFWVPTWK